MQGNPAWVLRDLYVTTANSCHAAGMQDPAGACMQNPAHASRLSVVNRTVPHQKKAFTFASRDHYRLRDPNDAGHPAVNSTHARSMHAAHACCRVIIFAVYDSTHGRSGP